MTSASRIRYFANGIDVVEPLNVIPDGLDPLGNVDAKITVHGRQMK